MCLANPYSGYKESYSVISLSLVTFARILADAIDKLLASPLIIGICLTSIPGIVTASLRSISGFTDNLLTAEHREASNQLRKIFYGVDTVEFNEGCGIKFINGQLNEIVSKIYVNKYFDRNSKIDVVSFENFQKDYNLYNILLAMNDCYHDKIIMKLKNKNVFGVLI